MWVRCNRGGPDRAEGLSGASSTSPFLSWASVCSSPRCWISCFSGLRILRLRPSAPRVLRPLHSERVTAGLPWFPSLQTAACEASRPPQPCEPVPITGVLVCLSLCSSYWVRFPGEPRLIHRVPSRTASCGQLCFFWMPSAGPASVHKCLCRESQREWGRTVPPGKGFGLPCFLLAELPQLYQWHLPRCERSL